MKEKAQYAGGQASRQKLNEKVAPKIIDTVSEGKAPKNAGYLEVNTGLLVLSYFSDEVHIVYVFK